LPKKEEKKSKKETTPENEKKKRSLNVRLLAYIGIPLLVIGISVILILKYFPSIFAAPLFEELSQDYFESGGSGTQDIPSYIPESNEWYIPSDGGGEIISNEDYINSGIDPKYWTEENGELMYVYPDPLMGGEIIVPAYDADYYDTQISNQYHKLEFPTGFTTDASGNKTAYWDVYENPGDWEANNPTRYTLDQMMERLEGSLVDASDSGIKIGDSGISAPSGTDPELSSIYFGKNESGNGYFVLSYPAEGGETIWDVRNLNVGALENFISGNDKSIDSNDLVQNAAIDSGHFFESSDGEISYNPNGTDTKYPIDVAQAKSLEDYLSDYGANHFNQLKTDAWNLQNNPQLAADILNGKDPGNLIPKDDLSKYLIAKDLQIHDTTGAYKAITDKYGNLAGLLNTIKDKNGNDVAYQAAPLSEITDAIKNGTLAPAGGEGVGSSCKDTESMADLISNDKVKSVWRGILGFINYFLIFILILIGFANILRIQIDTYAIKKILPTLIIAIILANFSFLICQILLELCKAIFSEINIIAGGGPNTNIVKQIWEAIFPYMKLISTTQKAGNWFLDHGLVWVMLGPIGFTALTGLFIGAILAFIVIVVFAILYFLLLIRKFVLIVLVVLSPLAFFALALPMTSNYFKMWWSQFMKWALMPIASYLVIALAIRISPAFGAAKSATGATATFFSYAFLLGSLVLAVIIPFKLGGFVMAGWGALGRALTGTGKGGYFHRKGAEGFGYAKQQAMFAGQKIPGIRNIIAAGRDWQARMQLSTATTKAMEEEALTKGMWKYGFGEHNDVYNKLIESNTAKMGRDWANSMNPDVLFRDYVDKNEFKDASGNFLSGANLDNRLKELKKTNPDRVRKFMYAISALKLIADNRVRGGKTTEGQARLQAINPAWTNPDKVEDIFAYNNLYSKPQAITGSGLSAKTKGTVKPIGGADHQTAQATEIANRIRTDTEFAGPKETPQAGTPVRVHLTEKPLITSKLIETKEVISSKNYPTGVTQVVRNTVQENSTQMLDHFDNQISEFEQKLSTILAPVISIHPDFKLEGLDESKLRGLADSPEWSSLQNKVVDMIGGQAITADAKLKIKTRLDNPELKKGLSKIQGDLKIHYRSIDNLNDVMSSSVYKSMRGVSTNVQL